jgi:hypothetical protein
MTIYAVPVASEVPVPAEPDLEPAPGEDPGVPPADPDTTPPIEPEKG